MDFWNSKNWVVWRQTDGLYSPRFESAVNCHNSAVPGQTFTYRSFRLKIGILTIGERGSLSLSFFLCLSFSLSLYFSLFLSLYLSFSLSFFLSLSLSFSLSFSLFLYLYIYISLSLSLNKLMINSYTVLVLAGKGSEAWTGSGRSLYTSDFLLYEWHAHRPQDLPFSHFHLMCIPYTITTVDRKNF